MTTWQDRQPQTRREARQSERSHEPDGQQNPQQNTLSRRAGTAEPTPGGETPQLVTPYTGVVDTVGPVVPEAQAAPRSDFDSLLARPPVPNYQANTFNGARIATQPTLSSGGPGTGASAVPVASNHVPAAAPQHEPRPSSFAPRPSTPEPPSQSQETTTRPEPALSDVVPERTLTRRELRAMLAAQEEEAAAGRKLDERPLSDSIGAVVPVAHPIAPAPDPASGPLLSDAPASAERAPEEDTPVPSQLPAGHWSLDIDVEDDADDQSFDQLLSRGVGAGGVPTTTNALILPSIPQQPGNPVPLTTGEVLVTGSIDLPRSMGQTGAHPGRIDSSMVDRLLDQVDESTPATNAQPIRASQAVSTHTSTRGVMTPPRRRGISVPTVLAITAAVLALGVLGLFIGGYIFKIF
ncbi:hypothetical protein [Luethyella okanaganae]|uniref:Uncharacterized protein n=1 Tax=Luethyella okanaganae TaxID=69372 RepID=A0ABW1VEU6_9MICO